MTLPVSQDYILLNYCVRINWKDVDGYCIIFMPSWALPDEVRKTSLHNQ
jgi:hypothetical protein